MKDQSKIVLKIIMSVLLVVLVLPSFNRTIWADGEVNVGPSSGEESNTATVSLKGLDNKELITSGSPTDPWTTCVNFGPVSNPLSVESGLRIERAQVTVSSGDIGLLNVTFGKYWTYDSANNVYVESQNSKSLFQIVNSSGSPVTQLNTPSDVFYIIPNINEVNSGLSNGRYRQAITISPAVASNMQYTFYADMNVVAEESNGIKFSSPVKANRDTTFLSKDCAVRLMNTLSYIVDDDPRITQVSSDPLVFYINVDGDIAGKNDVTVSFYKPNTSGDFEYAAVSYHNDCTVTNDSYSLNPYEYASGASLSYNTLTFNFVDKHTHSYHSSTDEEVANQVVWAWTGDEQNGFTAEVTLYCTNDGCPDSDKGEHIEKATVTEIVAEKETCTRGLRKGWKATASFGGNTYTCIKKSAVATKPEGHEWKFETDESKVEWIGSDTDGYTAAIIIKKCENEKHDVDVDGKQKIEVEAPVTVSKVDVKCGEYEKYIYTAVFDSTVDKDIKVPFTFTKEVKGKLVLHKWKVKSVSSNGDFNTVPTKAEIYVVCENYSDHKETVEVSDAANITLISETEKSKTYKYVGKTKDGQQVEGTEEFVPDHIEHNWTVEFKWDYDKTNKEVKGVSAVATCSVGKEQKTLEVEFTSKEVYNTKQYTATAEDPSGIKWSETKHIDVKTGELMDGAAAIAAGGTNIMIYGVEETYPFTGTKIKPVIVVMDGDVVLAQNINYTVSYKGKNKIGEINTIEVKGKGNYAGTSATAKFTIVDPKLGIAADELATSVKKVTLSNEKFTYNGKPQYPSTVTVTLKDGSQIVYTIDEEGNYSTESEKKVGLSICNNVNKGTAIVAATGSDGKTKNAKFKIEAADFSQVEFSIGEATWAVNPEMPMITATFNGMELVGGQDFKVKLSAKNAGDTGGTAKVISKGNFKGKHSDLLYKVNPLKLTEKHVIVSAEEGVKAKKVKFTVVDNLGKAINKKYYATEIKNVEGNTLNKTDIIQEEIKAIVKASGNVFTDNEGVVKVISLGKTISKAKVNTKSVTKTYTGEPIELDEDDFGEGKIVLTYGKDKTNLEYGKDFKIVSYLNNVNKGSMTVTIQGLGDYSGTKTFKVKIKAKPLDVEA